MSDSLKKINLFVYPTARRHSHDNSPDYYNTTPLSEEGIKTWCNVVSSPEQADYFYLGQISCGEAAGASPVEFEFLNNPKYMHKHIVTIEGDWVDNDIPSWLKNCIYTGNGAKLKYGNSKFCVRPCMSRLLVHIAKNNVKYDITYPNHVSLGFRGQLDPHGTRYKMWQAINEHNIPADININAGWCGSVGLDNSIIQLFAKVLQDNIISLCPRGAGEDTIRFYESCFFGRVPVVIGNCYIMGEDHFDTSFFYRLDPDLSKDQLSQELIKIQSESLDILISKAKLARRYFDEVVRSYYSDPTKYFLEFLKRHDL